LKAEQERQRREECERAISAAYQKAREVLCQNADVLAGFGVAGLSALVFVVLMRKPDVR
jgi:hypothetical protein